MHTKELATPWIRKSPPGICRGAFGPEERETTIDREVRLRFLVQSAFYLGIPVSQYDLEKRLLKS